MSPGASKIVDLIDDSCSPRHAVTSHLLPYWQQEVQDYGSVPSAQSYGDATASAIREIQRTESGTATNGQRTVGTNTKKNPVREEEVKKDSVSHSRRNQDVTSGKYNHMPTIDKDVFQHVQNRKRKPLNIVGSKRMRDNKTIKSAVRIADLYVGNCDLEATPETVSEYIHKEMNIVVQKM